jgi:Do/DeqQ family serine protease
MRAYRVLIPTLALIAAGSLSGVSPAQAQPAARVVPASAMGLKQSFAPVVRRAAPAVVNISSKRMVRQQVDPFWQLFGMGAPRNRIEGSLGSGVIVRSDGVIVTNNHVIEGGQEITVALADRREFRAKVLLADARTDLAILKIDLPAGEKLPVLNIDDHADSQVGDLVLAIGDPFGVGQTVTNGIISALNRTDPNAEAAGAYIQTDAAINPGNSGGPLVNLAGQVIGINTAIASTTGGSVGIGFAIPVDDFSTVVAGVIKTGKITVPYLGIRYQQVDTTLKQLNNLSVDYGALVSGGATSADPGVAAGSPAEKAGIQVGDIILQFNGNPIERSGDLPLLVANTPPGHRASVEVWRKGASRTLTVATNESKDDHVASNDDSRAPGGRLGLAVRPLTSQEKGEDGGKAGLLVEQVGGAAERAGVQPGDVLLALNGTPVRTLQELRNQLSKSGKHVALLIQRNDRQLFVPVELG